MVMTRMPGMYNETYYNGRKVPQGGGAFSGALVPRSTSIGTIYMRPWQQPSSPSQSANASAGQAGASNNISTSITPVGIFSPQQTQHAINQSAADAFTSSDPSFLMKQFSRPGRSADAGAMAATIPQLAQGSIGARSAMALQPLADTLANQAFNLQGQQARSQEGLGLASILANMQNIDQQRTNALINPLFQMLFQG